MTQTSSRFRSAGSANSWSSSQPTPPSWANELKGRSIRLNVISPGTIDTPAIANGSRQRKGGAAKAGFAARVPLSRTGTPHEDTVALLASELSSFIRTANLYLESGEKQLRPPAVDMSTVDVQFNGAAAGKSCRRPPGSPRTTSAAGS
ncbi:SDR family oxidoreductase [Amycolatopsis jejuensis]|uniref:SDR family oxidoreductase n=1 Tax=Amycolatopsis jejuensis TaxID=330084 RepID=UPI000A000C82|nr:SDR family oxidoreductase [Amycolatopsis jejuensis]